MRLRILLPKVNPEAITVPTRCAYAGCGGRKFHLRQHVAKEIGALARPDEIRFADALPKTRSGKIMRRLLRELATSGSVAGDVTTLEDFSVLEKLRGEEE